MLASLLLPWVLGTMIVLQGALNRKISEVNGLPSTILLNASVLVTASLAFYLLSRVSQSEGASINTGFNFKLWYLLPGLFGFAIVTGMPWGIARFGALKVFLGVIAAQLVASLIWDAAIELKPVTWIRLGGSLVAFLSAALVMWKG